MNRRDFMKLSALGALPFSTGLLSQQAHAASHQKRILILVELQGGNDSLNTLIPFKDKQYYQLRPTIAERNGLPITPSLAMNPNMRALLPYWQHTKDMAWIQGVGHPESRRSRSHFNSIKLLDRALNRHGNEGWLTRLLNTSHDISGVSFATTLGPLDGSQTNSIRIDNINSFIRDNQLMKNTHVQHHNDAMSHLRNTERKIIHSSHTLGQHLQHTPDESRHFPNSKFGKEMASVARLINSGVGIPSYKVTLSGFDTHKRQNSSHGTLLADLANTLHHFARNMKHHGQWNNVMVMTYSEFGRQVAENGNQGTDHGEASSHLIMGGRVRGGRVFGTNPDLRNLHNNALQHTLDIRSVYSTIASQWWGLRSPWSHPIIPFVA